MSEGSRRAASHWPRPTTACFPPTAHLLSLVTTCYHLSPLQCEHRLRRSLCKVTIHSQHKFQCHRRRRPHYRHHYYHRLHRHHGQYCGGVSICEHGRMRCRCVPCGGNSICEHNRIRITCRYVVKLKPIGKSLYYHLSWHARRIYVRLYRILLLDTPFTTCTTFTLVGCVATFPRSASMGGVSRYARNVRTVALRSASTGR